jgi:hypothetical protein
VIEGVSTREQQRSGESSRSKERRARAFGLVVRSAEPLPGAWTPTAASRDELELRRTSAATVADRWSGVAESGWEAVVDDARLSVEIGVDGDHRFLHEDRSVCHLSTDGRLLLCATLSDAVEPTWWRVVLDSVLFSVALLAGNEALHAGAVAVPAGAVAIVAASGGGKSTLLAALLERGLELVSDDVLALTAREGRPPLAHPGPPVMTVPRAASPGGATLLARVGVEDWVAHPVAGKPLPLAAVVVLDRRAGVASGLRPLASPLAPLLGSLLRFPHGESRERARFEMAAAVAEHCALWRLGADLAVPSSRLADMLLEQLHRLPPGSGPDACAS